MRAFAAQARIEVVLTLRRGESLLLTLGIPVLLLVFFSLVDVLPTGAVADDPVDFLAPGVLALAVMSTAMVSVGIATGFERQYGVLKRLGATPLGRPALLAAKTAAVLAVEAVQVAVLVPVALLLGWDPDLGGVAAAVAAVLVATVAFAGLGLLMAGTLRAEATLAGANLVYLLLVAGGAILVPLSRYPQAVQPLLELLPTGAFAEGLRDLCGGAGLSLGPVAVLAAWAVGAGMATARTFRWE